MSSPMTTPSAAPGIGLKLRMKNIISSAPLPLMVVVLVIVIIIVVVFIYMRYVSGTLKSVSLLKDSLIIANPLTSDYVISPGAKLPTQNGNENTYSLWMFVDNVSITNDHKIIMYRGNSASFANGLFYVYMDAKTNKLYASVRTNGAIDDASTAPEPSLEDIRANKYFMQSVIDYIPLQRWVHVAYTVKDTVFSTYLDGELYSVTSIYEMPVKPDGSRPLPSKPIGDVMLGGKAGKESFNGYIGNANYLNFAITMKEAKVLYGKGPYKKSWFSLVGLGNVGLRSPVYKYSTEDLK